MPSFSYWTGKTKWEKRQKLVKLANTNYDTIFDEEYATEYAMILSTDPQIAKQAEFRLSIRIYFSKIWKKILDTKMAKNEIEKCRIIHLWDGGELVQMTETFIHYEKETFEKIFEISAKIGAKNEKEKGIENKSGKMKKKASKKDKNRICEDILDKVRSNLLDTHSELMAKLSGETNAFSKLLKNSLEMEKGALAKLCDFYSAKSLIGNDNKKCSPNSVEVMAKMEQKYPKLAQMLRNKQSYGNEENGTTEQQKGAKGAQMDERKVGKKAWETDLDLEEGSALTFAYNKIFFVKNGTISDTVKQSFLIKAAHLQFKLWVQRLLEVLDLLKDKNSPKFTRMAIKLSIEATEMGFFERGGGAKGREVQLCQMISFIVHLMDNGTLRENEEWAIFIEGFARETDFLSAINEKVQLIKHDNNLWVKTKCEEPRLAQMIISHLKSPTTQGQIHMRVVHVLFNHFHDFLKHVALNGINFTKIVDYNGIGQNELLEFYIKHLTESNNFDETSLENEDKIAVLMKLLSLFSSRKEKKVIKNIEMGKELLKSGDSEIDKFTMIIRDNYVAKAETCALLKLIEIFAGKSAPIRMLCPLMHFIDFLEKQLSNDHQFWQFPRKCFQMEISEINRNQLKVLGAEHFNYLTAFIENAKEKDELLQILREKHGALYRLRLLVGGKNAIQRMWEMPMIRNKLLNRNFFTNKLHLLNHYRRFLLLDDQFAPNAFDLRLAERFGADVFVWMNWLEMDRHNQCTKVQKIMDDLHLYFRLLYDAYYFAMEMEDAMQILSFALPAIKTFVDESRNKMLNQTEINKEWGKLSRLIKKVADNTQNVAAQTEEDRRKFEAPIPIIQKLHFAEFMKLLNREENEDGSEKEKLERMLEDELISNKNNQQKMSEFLTENDLKRFYETIENGKREEKENGKGQSENDEKKKEKKEEKKRRKKEKKKTKKEEENNKINEKMEKKQIKGENEEEKGEIGQFGQNEKKEKQNLNEKEIGKSGGKAVEKRRDITEYNARRKLIKHNLAEELAKIHSLQKYLIENIGKNSSAEGTEINEQKILDGLSKIHRIVEEWSNGAAQLYISGSFFLGTRTISSDIDLLCIAPGKVIKLANFFGEENVFCKENECTTEQNDSLFCKFCQNKGVKNLIKTPFGKVFLIRFVLNGIDFDLTFVSIPAKRILPFVLNDDQIGKYINNFKSDRNFVHKNMLRALSSYRSTFYLANLFQENHANCAIPLPIRVPVQLAKLKLEENFNVSENWDPFFVRKPDEQEMPVYTPMFPEQNVAWHVTHSAARIIRREMKIALNKIKVMNEENLYELLTKATPFTEKYKTFILVNCASEQFENGEHFCRFVSGRIRLQIVYDIDQNGNGKTETQLYNGIYHEKCTLYEPAFLQNAFSFWPNFCKFWLIGIQSDQSREKMRKNLKNFDLKIKGDFVKYNQTDKDGKRRIDFHRINAEEIAEKFKELKMELKSTVVDREQIELLNSKDIH
ncbi:hypothetical protein niasHT_020469 [Heterodera trifolii]|uniref:polynucleotide adenylyltransferase n=1 Tax=Heterodera trifolii TaxID=157864 RepID=A0ABD2JGD7_9BILA